MARYRKIAVQTRNDKKVRALSDDGRLVWYDLLAHQNLTSVGGMRATIEGLAAEQRWPLPRYRRAIGEILTSGMAEYDPEACCLILPRFLRHNEPESPNVVRSWPAAFELIPECALKDKLVMIAKTYIEDRAAGVEGKGKGFRKAFQEAFPEAFAKSMANQELELEQEQEQEPSHPSLADFGTWYEAYPRKVGLAKAKEAWRSHRLAMPLLAEMLTKLEQQKASQDWTEQGGRFVPHPTTYLNQGRWSDEVRRLPTSGRGRILADERRAEGSDESRKVALDRLTKEAES